MAKEVGVRGSQGSGDWQLKHPSSCYGRGDDGNWFRPEPGSRVVTSQHTPKGRAYRSRFARQRQACKAAVSVTAVHS